MALDSAVVVVAAGLPSTTVCRTVYHRPWCCGSMRAVWRVGSDTDNGVARGDPPWCFHADMGLRTLAVVS